MIYISIKKVLPLRYPEQAIEFKCQSRNQARKISRQVDRLRFHVERVGQRVYLWERASLKTRAISHFVSDEAEVKNSIGQS